MQLLLNTPNTAAAGPLSIAALQFAA